MLALYFAAGDTQDVVEAVVELGDNQLSSITDMKFTDWCSGADDLFQSVPPSFV